MSVRSRYPLIINGKDARNSEFDIRHSTFDAHPGAWYVNGSIFYDLAVDNAYFGNNDLAVQCLDSAILHQHTWDWGYNNDPMLDPLRGREDFKEIMKKLNDFKLFRKQAFANAYNRMEASGDLKSILK